MLKPIPHEIPDDHNEDCQCKPVKMLKKGRKDTSPKRKRRSSAVQNSQSKLLRAIGRKLFLYGKKAKQRTGREIQVMIQEMQRSILCLQKQQRAEIRRKQNMNKKNRKKND